MKSASADSNIEQDPVVGSELTEVCRKQDGSFVVTLNGYRTHVTRNYNPPLHQAVLQYVEQGGDCQPYDEDVLLQAAPEILASAWIEQQLTVTEQIVSEYRDARDLLLPTAISTEQFSELLSWRQAIRAWPKTDEYPLTPPLSPSWMSEVVDDGL